MYEGWTGAFEAKPALIDDLDRITKELLDACRETKVWLFFGEMGSGKTTLIKNICKRLGVAEITNSPTFSIANEYWAKDGSRICHFDFYRIGKETEAYDMGIEEYFESGSFCFVEWPERIESLYPLKYFAVRITEHSPTSRLIEYKLS